MFAETFKLLDMEKQFMYEKLPVRTKVGENEEIWFAGIDMCNILGYVNASKTIESKLDEDERELEYLPGTSGQRRKGWNINEFGLYSLILSSTKPEAKVFKRWITHEVLPAIRKAGKYTTEGAQRKEADIQALIKEIESLKTDITDQQSALKDLKAELSQKQDELLVILKTDPNQLKLEI